MGADEPFTKGAESTPLLPLSQDAKAGSAELTLNIITAGLGTGIFTLPWSIAGASCFTGIAIIAGVLLLNAWTISILVEAAESYQVFDVGSLLARLPGRLGRISEVGVNVVVWLGTFACLVSYLIVVADCSLPYVDSQSSTLGKQHLRAKIVVLASVLVLPLCSLDQRRLAFTSSLAVGSVAMIFVLLVSISQTERANGENPQICIAGLARGSVAMMAAMMQTVVIQVCILPMYGEMRDRSPAAFRQVLTVSFGVLFVICTGFSLVGYYAFGGLVRSNVLVNLPFTPSGNLGRACAIVSVLAVYPIMLKPMIAVVEAQGYPDSATRFFIVAAVMLCACLCEDLGRINILNGSISMGVFVALVPFLVGLYLMEARAKDRSWRAAMISLLVIGLVSSALGLYLVDNYHEELQAACLWAAGETKTSPRP